MTPILPLTFAPPRTTRQRVLRMVADSGQLTHLPLEQQARVAGQPLRHAVGARVGAVRGPERVVDVDVRQAREPIGEVTVVLRFALLEPRVLQQAHISGRQTGDDALDRVADNTGGKLDGSADQLMQARATGASESSGSRSFGRPRCDARMISAPRSRSSSIVGSAALIRVSSATSPPSSGTLKSTRTRTRAPSTGASRTLAFEKDPRSFNYATARAGSSTFPASSTTRLE